MYDFLTTFIDFIGVFYIMQPLVDHTSGSAAGRYSIYQAFVNNIETEYFQLFREYFQKVVVIENHLRRTVPQAQQTNPNRQARGHLGF